MTGLELGIGLAGVSVSALVAVAMVLITPRGRVAVHEEGSDPKGSNLSPVPAREPRGMQASR